MTHVTCRLTAKNRDQLRNPTLGNRVWATFYLVSYVTVTLCTCIRERSLTVAICCTHAGTVGDRVRGGAVSESDGRVQLRRRWHTAGLRRAQAQRRTQALHVAMGRVHHRIRVRAASWWIGASAAIGLQNIGNQRRRIHR